MSKAFLIGAMLAISIYAFGACAIDTAMQSADNRQTCENLGERENPSQSDLVLCGVE